MCKKSSLLVFFSFAVITASIITACSHSKGNSVNEDSIHTTDSIAEVENETARMEALRQDSIANTEREKYDAMISECEKAENIYNKYAKKYSEHADDDFTDYYTLANEAYERYRVKYEALLEVIDNFTPEQFDRVQKIEKKLIDPRGYLWG